MILNGNDTVHHENQKAICKIYPFNHEVAGTNSEKQNTLHSCNSKSLIVTRAIGQFHFNSRCFSRKNVEEKRSPKKRLPPLPGKKRNENEDKENAHRKNFDAELDMFSPIKDQTNINGGLLNVAGRTGMSDMLKRGTCSSCVSFFDRAKRANETNDALGEEIGLGCWMGDKENANQDCAGCSIV
jgi:hypothetical protein